MKLFVSTLFMLLTFSVSAQFSLKGKLRTLRPLTIKVTDLSGNTIVECSVKSGEEFKTKPVRIKKDLYNVHFGSYSEMMILTDSPVILKGFLNEDRPEESSIEFDGIDLYMQYMDIMAKFKASGSRREEIQNPVKNDSALDPVVRVSLMYLNKIFFDLDYESYRQVLDMIPENERESRVVKYLVDEVARRRKFALGQQAYNFTFVGLDGNDVSLSDFKGKLVLLDFSASWCGGCRTEARKLVKEYDSMKGDDLVVITISMDNREKDWRRMVEEDKLPWVTLWNREGFTKGNKQNVIQDAYGFYQIPFIVLIDKEGKIIARDLRGDEVKKAIEKARKTYQF